MVIFELIIDVGCIKLMFERLEALDEDKVDELKYELARAVEGAFEEVTGVYVSARIEDLNIVD